MPKDVIPTTVTTGPLPASRKVHVAGERNPELRVAMREIVLSPESGEPPLRVYDASGPYTDPAALIDIGAGLPTVANTHEIAQLVNPWARVVYLDNDPMCVAHGRVMLETNEDTVYLQGDLTDPGVLAEDSAVWRYLDRGRPVAVILGSVLHHIENAAEPAEIVARCVRALSPGSFVAITHYWDPADASPEHELAREVERRFLESGLGTGWFRSRAEIVSCFGDLELVEPGVVPVDEWWPSGPPRLPGSREERLLLGGIGRKSERPPAGSATVS